MLRTCICLLSFVIITGCDKNWRGLLIEKRIYRDGYYVHLPWKRYTPKTAYPKPQPYPVDHSRTAVSDTTSNDASRTQAGVTRQATSDTTIQQNSNGGGGSALPPQSPVASNTTGRAECSGNRPAPPPPVDNTPQPPASPPVAYSPPPQLQPEPVNDPKLPAPPATPITPDSSTASTDSTAPPTDSIADKRKFQFPEGEFSFIAELGFYNSASATAIEVKPQSFNAGVGARYTIHPFARHKIAAEGSLFNSSVSIRQDQHKQSPLFVEPHGKERIMQLKARFMLLDHFYITRSDSALIDALEIGLFADAGFFSTHVAVDYHGNDDKAALTRSKTRLYELKYIRTMQYGFTLRIANEKWSAFMNYRFNSLLKTGRGGDDLPKVVVGVSRSLAS